MGHSVGPSSYGDLRGIEQFVSREDVADQVSSLAYEFDTQFPGARERGDRLTVNEGIRSKRRMEILRAAWETYLRNGTPFAALAAALYFSTHREEIGTALDFGITRKDGINRAMTTAEAAWVHEHGVRRGIVWTGRSFNPQESWHHNGGYPASIPPITGVNRPGTPLYTDCTPETPAPTVHEEDDDMKIIWAADHSSAVLIAGGKRLKLDAKSPTLGKGREPWLKQAQIFEKACRVDVTKDWPGDDQFSPTENDLLVALLGRLK